MCVKRYLIQRLDNAKIELSPKKNDMHFVYVLGMGSIGKTPNFSEHGHVAYPGLQIRVRIGKLVSLFLIQNICCGYSKEPSQ